MRANCFLLGICAASALLAQPPRRAPGFSLPDTNNQQVDLADFRGKVVVLEIMRTNCEHCAAFSHILGQVNSQYAGRVAVVSIAPAPDNPSTVAAFIAANKITYPIVYDCGQVVYSYVRPSPLSPTVALPHIYIIGADGFIISDHVFAGDTQEIFRGRGLFTELDRILKLPAKKP